MIDFGQLLARANEQVLQDLLGRKTVRLLSTVAGRAMSTHELHQALLEIRGPIALLRDPDCRACLFELLRADEARQLADALGLDRAADPFAQLGKTRVSKRSAKEQILFGALGLFVSDTLAQHPKLSVEVVEPEYALFAHQRKAAAEAVVALNTADRRVLLHMPTGSGKTRTAMAIIAKYLLQNAPAVAIWLATTEELCDQAAEEFVKAWSKLGNRPVSVHRFWGNHELDVDAVRDGLVVTGIPKLHAALKRSIPFLAKLADKSALVVVDEAHQAIARTYSLVTSAMLARRSTESALLGLSATPGRTWANRNADRELANFFSGAKVTLKVEGYSSPIDYLVAEGYLAKPAFSAIEYHSPDRLSDTELARLADELDIPESLLERLAADELRSVQIVRTIEGLAQRHARIIVFATTVQHAVLLAPVLRAVGLQARAVHGATESADREQFIRWYKTDADEVRVLCNYGVLTTGFDAPRTSAAVIARPTRSLVLYSQMVGRAIRGTKAGGNATAEIVTVVDTMLPGFGDLGEAFSNWEDVW